MPAVGRARPRVALATYEQSPALAPDDRLLPPALESAGISAIAAVWSDPSVDWSAFDGVVIRSCWDYHLRADEFMRWLAMLERVGTPVWNSPALVRWNSDKSYLLDLVARGVPTIETMLVPAGAPDDVERIARERGWSRFVVKPAVSASGWHTYALGLPLDDASRATIARVVGRASVLVQPFAAEVPATGELSFTFIDGALSHTTLKRAAAGEFRVQTEHGGSVELIETPAALAGQAARVLGALDEMPLYARVDGIERDGRFLLMELELIEPNLFLEFSTPAAGALARAIADRLVTRANVTA